MASTAVSRTVRGGSEDALTSTGMVEVTLLESTDTGELVPSSGSWRSFRGSYIQLRSEFLLHPAHRVVYPGIARHSHVTLLQGAAQHHSSCIV